MNYVWFCTFWCTLLVAQQAQVSPLNSQLRRDASAGKCEQIKTLISQGAQVNGAGRGGVTPLFLASENGHTTFVQLLIQMGAQIDVGNDNKATPLFIASQNGHKKVAELLLSAGARLDTARVDGVTPLVVAVHHGHAPVVKLLLDHSIRNNITVDITQAVIAACEKSRHAVLNVFISARVPMTGVTPKGISPLLIACNKGNAQLAEILINQGANINQPRPDGITPLHLASQNGSLACTEVLLANGADTESKTVQSHKTPLHCAVLQGHTACVEELLKASANPLARDITGSTARDYARTYPQIQALLSSYSSNNSTQGEQKSPYQSISQRDNNRSPYNQWPRQATNVDYADVMLNLYSAARSGDSDKLELALSFFQTANVPDDMGNTALYYAVEHSHTNICKKLLARDADPHQKNRHGVSPYELAHQKNNTQILTLFSHPSATHSSSEQYDDIDKIKRPQISGQYRDLPSSDLSATHSSSEQYDDVDKIKRPHIAGQYRDLPSSALSDTQNYQGQYDDITSAQRPHIASHYNNLPYAHNYGYVDINHIYVIETLFKAARSGNLDELEFVIQLVEAINVADKAGHTALHYAAQYGHTAVCKKLLEHGADPLLKNNQGETAQDIAQQNNYHSILNLFSTTQSSSK